MPLIFTGIPEGHPQHKTWTEAGKPPLKDLPNAKAHEFVFPYMELVKGYDRRHEEKLADWFKRTGYPIQLFDGDDEELMGLYFEAHPEEIPSGIKQAASFMAKLHTRQASVQKEGVPITDLASAAAAESSGAVQTIGRRSKSPAAKEARAASGAEMQTSVSDRDARFTDVYDSKFAEHKAAGKSDKQAAFYSKKSAVAASKTA